MTNGWQSVVGCLQTVRYLISRADVLTSFAPSFMRSMCLYNNMAKTSWTTLRCNRILQSINSSLYEELVSVYYKYVYITQSGRWHSILSSWAADRHCKAGCKAVATCLQVHGFFPDSIIRYSQNHNDMEGANNNESRNRSTELLL